MTKESINDIIINLENNKTIIATNKMFDKLYISNINSNGDEIPFEDDNHISNFFMIKLKPKTVEYNYANMNVKENVFNIINNVKNIESVIINFKNGKSIPFIINSNKVFYSFKDKNNLCILQSEYDIKYLKNLFI